MKHASLWIDTTESTNYPVLQQNLEVDAVVVGGGIVGITCAFLLQKDGLKVVLLEKKKIIEKTTGHTTAKVTSLHGVLYKDLLKTHGEEIAKAYWEANIFGVEKVEQLVKDYQIDCDFLPNTAFTYATTSKELKEVEEEMKALEVIHSSAKFEEKVDLPFSTMGAISLSDQSQFHPRKYLLSLLLEFIKKGGLVFEQSKAEEIKEENSHLIVNTKEGKINCEFVVVASHIPFMNLDYFHEKMTRFRDYVIAIKIKGKVPTGMYISSGENYHSLRFQPIENEKLLIIDGEGHEDPEEKEDESKYKKLIDYAHQNFDVDSVEYYWSTYDFSSKDKLPYIGKSKMYKENVFQATGFGGWGMSNGTMSAFVIANQILGVKNPDFSRIFSH